MPRTARIYIENACYHIIARGTQKKVIFVTDEDFGSYIKLLFKYKKQSGCRIYSFCLMPNHVHLLIDSPSGLLHMSKLMHNTNQTYAMIFNSRYDKTGHLWEGRYKSRVVYKDDYLHNLISYIEFNPVRAGLVNKPEDYFWSSYRARILEENNPILDKMNL